MARQARGESIDPNSVQIVHTTSRCVRRAFLCGNDSLSGKSFDHRKLWIRDRLEFLASVFGIDCLTYSVMSNHLHQVLRSRPDVVESWSDEEVARRWLRLYPKRRNRDGSPKEPNEKELGVILNNSQRLSELRKRLSDISWWMRCTSEKIARQSNREDGCKGRFWEGRFKSQLLLDDASLLACAMYVDLNPIRAAIAETPETSRFTGAYDRICDRQALARSDATKDHPSQSRAIDELECRWSGWLSPILIDHSKPPGPQANANMRRASDKGFLPISQDHYLALLDWTGRKIRDGKRGSIPDDLAPILDRLEVDTDAWCDLVARFGKLFKRVVGKPDALEAEAARRGQQYFQAPGAKILQAA